MEMKKPSTLTPEEEKELFVLVSSEPDKRKAAELIRAKGVDISDEELEAISAGLRNTSAVLSDDELEAIVGGAEISSSRYENLHYKYDIGNKVEVYNTFFHVTTTRCRISARRKCCVGDPEFPDCDQDHCEYWCEPVDSSSFIGSDWRLESDIEH